MSDPKTCPVCNRGEVCKSSNTAVKYFCQNVDCRAWTFDGMTWKKPNKLSPMA